MVTSTRVAILFVIAVGTTGCSRVTTLRVPVSSVLERRAELLDEGVATVRAEDGTVITVDRDDAPSAFEPSSGASPASRSIGLLLEPCDRAGGSPRAETTDGLDSPNRPCELDSVDVLVLERRRVNWVGFAVGVGSAILGAAIVVGAIVLGAANGDWSGGGGLHGH